MSCHLDALLRGLIIERLGKYGDQATVAEAQKRFEEHWKGESTIPADLIKVCGEQHSAQTW